MQQHDQRPIAGLYVMQPLVADLGVTLPNVGAQEFCRLLFRRLAAATGVVVSCGHCTRSPRSLLRSTVSRQPRPGITPLAPPATRATPWSLDSISSDSVHDGVRASFCARR